MKKLFILAGLLLSWRGIASAEDRRRLIEAVAVHPIFYNRDLREDRELDLNNWLFLRLSTNTQVGNLYGDSAQKTYRLDHGMTLEIFVTLNCRHGAEAKECILILDVTIYKSNLVFKELIIGNVKMEMGFDQHDESIGRTQVSIAPNKRLTRLDKIGIAVQVQSVPEKTP